ncbi:metalloproteinase inhibitor 1 isoform X1 [Polyergus mexicanus]|uniref:metalloproteinase inhibitor 1 isoform X1 n=2 Tax=Polyergus mexicanus TaxID=615972 RepID=UPI0038B46F70
MSSEALFTRARMYGCWPAVEYNSGNTLELGQSCFDARLRNFHLRSAFVARKFTSTVRVISSWAFLEMWRLLLWTHFLLLTVLLAPVQKVAACSCAQAHPQTKFCESDFVAVVRVKKVLPVNEYEIAYKVKINRVFKSNPKADVALMQNLLRTPSSDSMCGVTLKVGETYVLNGRVVSGQALISFCGLSIRWADTTSRQRKGLRQLYQQGCVCDILYTHWRRKGAVLESSGGKRCLWESTPGPQDCQEKYGVCMAVPGGCSWVPSVPYKNCIKEYQRQRDQQRLREP